MLRLLRWVAPLIIFVSSWKITMDWFSSKPVEISSPTARTWVFFLELCLSGFVALEIVLTLGAFILMGRYIYEKNRPD